MKFCAILGKHPSDTPGGAEFQTQLICSELQERGYETSYIAYDSDEQKIREHDGVTVHHLCTTSKIEKIRQIKLTIKDINPDILYFRNFKDLPLAGLFSTIDPVHTVFNISHDAQCLPRYAHFPGKTNQTLLHSIYHRVKLSVRRSFLVKPDTLFVQTGTQQQMLKNNWDLDSVLIGNGHPLPESNPQKQSPPVVLWLASLKEWKQPSVFVELARKCQDLECKFWLVGRPSDETLANTIEVQAKELPNLEYLGGCSIEESNEYLEKASLFINTSRQEGFPNTFIQGWMRKTPVISLNVNPFGERTERKTGYYGLQSKSELVKKTRRLIERPRFRQQLGEQAYKYARKNHDIRLIVDRVENNLQKNGVI
jgi:glycosyltransferase involved in cell wall biosynthesis